MRIDRSSALCAGGLAWADIPAYALRMASTLAERIKQTRILMGLDQTQFGELAGVSQSTVNRWEKGAQPKPEALRKLAEIANRTVDEMIGVQEPPIVIEGYDVRWVPLVGLASASSWREAIAMPMGEVSVRADKAGRNAFAVEIKGDSMDKLLPEGGWAIVDPDQVSLYDNRVYLVSNLEHESTLKRYRSNPARLEPCSNNPEHETIVITPSAVHVVGRVVAYGNDDGL